MLRLLWETSLPRSALAGLLARGAVCPMAAYSFLSSSAIELIFLLFILIDPTFLSGITQDDILLPWSEN